VVVTSDVTTCVVGGVVSSPLTGVIAGMTVAAITLALRKRRPAIKEVAMVLGVVTGTVAMFVLVDHWSDFKEGIVDGFSRFRRS
jgi:xanthine/uracil permease